MRKRFDRHRTIRTSNRNEIIFAAVAIGGIITLGLCSPARAQDVVAGDPRWDVSANVAVASDYVFRGVSQTDAAAAISVGVDVTDGRIYGGAWASNVSYAGDPDTKAEIDLYGGVRGEAAGWNLDVGGVAYIYTNQPDGSDYSYVELKLAASRPVGAGSIGAAVFFSPDFFGAAEDEATYAEVNAAWPLADRVTLSGALGRQWVSSDFDYTSWNVGAAFALTDAISLDARWYDTDQHAFGPVYDGRAVVSLKGVF